MVRRQLILKPQPVQPTPEVTEPEEIVEEDTPQAEPVTVRKWALVNLIVTIISVLIALITAFSFLKKSKEEQEEDETSEEEKKHRKRKLLTLIPAVISVVVLVLTEDFRLKMGLIDKYTLLMAILMIVTAIMALITRNKNKDQDDQEEA